MEIPTKKIASLLEKLEKKEVKQLKKKKKLKLSVILVGESADQISFVKIKKKVAEKLGIKFDLHHLKKTPSFEKFIHFVKDISSDPEVTGVIIQQPLPSQIQTQSIYDFIPYVKEIEGHRKKTPFIAPIGLSVLTALKYVFNNQKIGKDLMVDFLKDKTLFKRILKNKKVVLVGRGQTGGQPIGKTLNETGINYINVYSQTPNPQEYYKSADIVITAVGKKIITPEFLKEGAVLINVGLRRENGKLKGDYDEKEIRNTTSFYTTTPGGIGPIDVLYLYKNLIEAAKMQR